MPDIENSICRRFADELGELIVRQRNLPADDRPCLAEIVGCLHVAAFELMAEESNLTKENDDE